MSNKVNDDVAENYIQEGIDAGLLDSRANLFCVWKMEREGHGTVNEYLAENTLKLPKYAQLNDKLNIISRRKDILEETVRELTEKNRLLEKEVNLSEEKVNNAYKRIAEYANKAYMKRLGDADTLTGELIDVA